MSRIAFLLVLLVAAPLSAAVIYPPLVGEVYQLKIMTQVGPLNAEGIPLYPPAASVGIRDKATQELIQCVEWSALPETPTDVQVTVPSTGSVRVLEVVAYAALACNATASPASNPAENVAAVYPGVSPNSPALVP